jgi:hypothetical protein
MNVRSVAMSIRILVLLALSGLPVRAAEVHGRQDKPAVVSRPTMQEAADEEGLAETRRRLDVEWLPFPDPARFKVLGLHWFDENKPKLWRMPVAAFDSLPSGVKRQAKAASGGRLLLRCNTASLGLRVLPQSKGNSSYLDVYVNGRYLRSVTAEEANTEASLTLFTELDRKEKEIVIYLPYRQELVIRAVGVDKGTVFGEPQPSFAKPLPIVFYGSSVCQGSGAYKPGMTYEAILGRELNVDFVNLGFGGAGKAEANVVNLVNSIPACCYVFDLGKSYGMQDKTAYKRMLQTVRASHPDVPMVCVTPITSSTELHSEEYLTRSHHTREVMREAVRELMQAGDKNLHLMEGPDLLGFDDHDGLSKDGVHPTDFGYSLIARGLAPVLKKALGQR